MLVTPSALTPPDERNSLLYEVTNLTRSYPESRLNLRIPPFLFQGDSNAPGTPTVSGDLPGNHGLSPELTQEILDLCSQGTLSLINPGYSCGDQSLMKESLLEREQLWGLANPRGTGLEDLLAHPPVPHCTLMPRIDPHRPGPLNHSGALVYQNGEPGLILTSPDTPEILQWMPLISARSIAILSWMGSLRLYRTITGTMEQRPPIISISLSSREDTQTLQALLEADRLQQEKGRGIQWQFISRMARELPPIPADHLPHPEFPPGWESTPGDAAPDHARPASQTQELWRFSPYAGTKDIPESPGRRMPQRELVASMLGSAELQGDGFAVGFSQGRLESITFENHQAFWTTQDAWGAEFSGRSARWEVESAFSFETEDYSCPARGLRQITTLQHSGFTHPGRTIADFLCIDGMPGLIIELWIQHPWVDRGIVFDSYVPWSLEFAEPPKAGASDPSGELDPGISITRFAGRQGFTTASHQVLRAFESPKPRFPLGKTDRAIRILTSGSSHSWQISTPRGDLSLLHGSHANQDSILPGSLLWYKEKGSDSPRAGIAPLSCYSNLPAKHLQGILEHLTVVVCAPGDSPAILKRLGEPRFSALRESWVIRS